MFRAISAATKQLFSRNSNSIKSDDFALDALPYFRRLGFYPDLADASDEEVIQEIRRRHSDPIVKFWVQRGKAPPKITDWQMGSEPPIADLVLLEYDRCRVSWLDLECGYPGEYKAEFARWSEISRGAFSPVEVREEWTNLARPNEEAERLTIRLDFTTDSLRLTPRLNGDWFDVTPLDAINERIHLTGYQFEIFEPFDQTAFIVVLREDEKRELESIRNWRFCTHPFRELEIL